MEPNAHKDADVREISSFGDATGIQNSSLTGVVGGIWAPPERPAAGTIDWSLFEFLSTRTPSPMTPSYTGDDISLMNEVARS